MGKKKDERVGGTITHREGETKRDKKLGERKRKAERRYRKREEEKQI